MNRAIDKAEGRVPPESLRNRDEYLLYLRRLFAYDVARDTLPAHASVLEIGARAGYGTQLLSGRVAKVVALDVDPSLIAEAARKHGSSSCVFGVFDGHRIPYGDETFDAVVSFQMLDKLADDVALLREVRRVLKFGGTFLVTTPNRASRSNGGEKPRDPAHLREYYPGEFENLLKTTFAGVKLWGIRASEEVQRWALARMALGSGLRPPETFGLRKFLPKVLRHPFKHIVRLLSRRNGRKQRHTEFQVRYSLSDFHIIKSNLEESLDLLGMITK